MSSLGIKTSVDEKNVLVAQDFELSFNSEFDMYKIKKEQFAQNGQTIQFDHGLGYYPFYLNYAHNSSITDGRAFGNSTTGFVNPHSAETTGYLFLAFNYGVL